MSKFFELCEDFDPSNDKSPAYELYEFLKSKDVDVSLIKGTLTINTEAKKIAVKVKPEEDAEDPTYNVNKEVEGLADTAASRLTAKGLGAALIRTQAQKAKSAVNRRQKQVLPKAIDLYDKKTKALERDIGKATRKTVGGTDII